MSDDVKADSIPLIRCENEACRNLSTEAQLKESKGTCPHCGKQIEDPYALNELHNLLSQTTIQDMANLKREDFVDRMLEAIPENRRKALEYQLVHVWYAAKTVHEATKPWK